MKDKKYDCIIVGSGPAGLVSAYYLLQNNINNICILEKNKKNHHKPCAGLLPQKAYYFLKDMNIDVLEELDYFKMDNNNIYYKNNLSLNMDISFNKDKFHWLSSYTGKRENLDTYLKNFIENLKVTIIYDTKIENIDIDNNTIYTDDTEYEYDNIIFADGCKGYSQKYVSNKNRKQNFSMEAVFKDVKNMEQFVNIYFGITKKGYAWFGSTGENLNIGFTDEYNKSENYIEKLKKFGEQLGYKIESEDIKGAFFPCGINKYNNIKENMYFVGDSGGFADPLTAEGIYYAFETARIAALAVSKKDKKIFLKGIKPIKNKLKGSMFIRKFFFNSKLQKLIWGSKFSKKHSNFITYTWIKLMLENKYSYSQILKCYFDYKTKKIK